MNYQTFQPQQDLASIVKCFWSLEVAAAVSPEKQRVVPDGCIELIFILGDDIRRYVSETDTILQPSALIVGQITEPFIIEPTGHVHCFAARFYPFGFGNLVSMPIQSLANRETPLAQVFGDAAANALERQIRQAVTNHEMILAMEQFLLDRLTNAQTVDTIVTQTVADILASNGSASISALLKDDPAKRRQMERKFLQQVGISPKQLSKVIRLQAALKLLLQQQAGSLTQIAYESEYYDQAHFTRDFKEFTGVNPKDFLGNDGLLLSTIFYAED